MEINIPEILAEVTAAFRSYQAALTNADVAVLNELFWDSPHTIRYGITENLHAHAAIVAFRVARTAGPFHHDLLETVITTYGRDFGTANTVFRRQDATQIGRQSHTWMCTPQGWRIVAAHVSMLPPPAASSG
jgi:hypothetical protein